MNLRRHQIPEPVADCFGNDIGASLPVMPGFREMALRRSADEQAARMAEDRGRLVRELAEQRQTAGLSQTEIAARMGTSQSAVARLESGAVDVRASTLERYAAAVGGQINNKSMMGTVQLSDAEADRIISSGITAFLRAYGPPAR